MINADAFLKAYEQYADAIFRYIYFRVFDHERARESTQEVFTKTWEYLVQGKEIKNLRAFLYQVARNHIIDSSRKKRPLSLDELQEVEGFEPGYDHRETLEKNIDARSLTKYIDELDGAHREVIVLRYVNDCKPKEIAEIIGESENVVSVRIHRALKYLKKIIAER